MDNLYMRLSVLWVDRKLVPSMVAGAVVELVQAALESSALLSDRVDNQSFLLAQRQSSERALPLADHRHRAHPALPRVSPVLYTLQRVPQPIPAACQGE